jgi:PAS domain S-box-containing protein
MAARSVKSKKTRAGKPAEASPPTSIPALGTGFPVVAIGASSGGLNALEAFFRNVPPESGMAFVLAMHLSSEHESQLAQILQAFTAMPIMQVSTAVEVLPDHVYVIAPRQQLSLKGNCLQVSSSIRPVTSGVIDHLFLSLAEDRQERAIGIVLSGIGADGTLGLLAIKERGGLLLAQDPEEAEYGAMPRSSIATGLVDFVLPVAEMPARLIMLRDQAPRPVLSAEHRAWPEDDTHALRDILKRLHTQTGYDFTHYKRTALLRQIGRRVRVLHAGSLPVYARRLHEDGAEVATLFRNLLVCVTQFFRNPEAYHLLEREMLPKIFEEAAAGDGEPAAVRVWVPGCATGEEAYSLAMLLAERREAADPRVPIKLLATDIDEGALTIARRGRYLDTVVSGMPPARLQRFFDQEEGAYRVTDELRALVVFAAHDLMRDPAFARIDLISCRNVLMYFEAGIQQQVLEHFAYSLRPGGYLFLGSSEGAVRASSLFTPVSTRYGVFQQRGAVRPSALFNVVPRTRVLPETQGAASRSEIDDLEQSNERLYDTNEALILANQEMQSLNEELRSMMEAFEVAKEELQSLNEELTTVNQELQNKIEEHRRVNIDLHNLIGSTRMVTLFLDAQLNVQLYTPESTKLFNLLPIDVGRPLEHLSHRLMYADVLHDTRQVLKGGAAIEREVQARNGNWYLMRVMPYQTTAAQAVGVVLTFADITSQKKMEQVSVNRFTLAFHAGPMAASIVRRDDGRFLDVNKIFEQITGYTRKDVIGQPALAFGLRFGGEKEPPAIYRPGGPARDEVETRIRTKAGVMRDLIVSTTPIEFDGRPCYLSLFYDVTERKHLEREILQVTDREQRRIGVDLHDGLGTHLTGIAMMARGLARNLRAGRTVEPEEMDEIARLVGDGIEQARTLAQGLNPFLLEVLGLRIALRELAANLEAQTGITCSFEEDGGVLALSSERSMHLYRIAQEALTNATRHAQATQIRITLSSRDDRCRLTIHDNGSGFQETRGKDEQGNASGMGLHIMRYRADMIGARLDVASTSGGGTTITCSFGIPT